MMRSIDLRFTACIIRRGSFNIGVNNFVRNYSSKKSKDPNKICTQSKKDNNTGSLFTIGAVTLIGLGTVAYAKYDPQFRHFLGDNIPYADGFFRFIFQEEQLITDKLAEVAVDLASLMSSENKESKKKTKEQITADYTPPRAVFPGIAEKNKEEITTYNEIRQMKDEEGEIAVVEENIVSTPKLCPAIRDLADLETKLNETACIAITAYRNAENALKEYNEEIDKIVEQSVERVKPSVWVTLKQKSEYKKKIIDEAECNTKLALEQLEKLKASINDPDLDATEAARGTVLRNIERLRSDIKEAKEHFEYERDNSELIDRYWKKIECARNEFIDELQIMFPDFDINKKSFKMQPSDLDLFLIHVFSYVCYYQKELNKLQVINKNKLERAIDACRRGDPNFSIIELSICQGIEEERRKLVMDFQKKCLALRKESEAELRHTLKCQEQAHIDHLGDVVAQREVELEREFSRKLDEQIAIEQSKYKMQLAGMIARMKGMRNVINERMEADKIARQSQVLWSACQALHRAVKSAQPGDCWSQGIRPLASEVEAIQQAAAENDELVNYVVAGIPKEAIERGVFSEGIIRERFLKVERVARRLALVSSTGAPLPMYILSYLQSLLLINSVNPIPQTELEDKKCDFTYLNTYDILQRARYWLDRGNYEQALRYMNLLRGAARCVANDWMKETRILLETQQAAETLMAHAVAGGLLHI